MLKQYSILGFLISLFFLSCAGKQASETPNTDEKVGEFVTSDSVIQYGNITTTISSDTNKLKGILKFNHFAPTSIRYHFTYIDNSGSKERVSIPGPSDYNLEAILYFDSTSFVKIRNLYKKADWIDPKYKKEEFNFAWLDTITKQQLLLSDTIPHGYIDLFWTDPNAQNCHLWVLDKKILLHRSSN